MNDRIERLGRSLIQHGPHNRRIYLMKLHAADLPQVIPGLDRLARSQGHTKVFAKVPRRSKKPFIESGYTVEARIPGFYRGEEEAVFLGKYFSPERLQEKRAELVTEILARADERGTEAPPPLEDGLRWRRTEAADAEEMAALYREVFATYPFPIHDPSYLRQTMAENVAYFGIWEGGRLLALASAEIDREGENAEMTDFATRPECRGRGLASFLLARMEREMHGAGIRTLYTIARAYSHGMNLTFAKGGYAYAGTLTNNTNISGSLESMNVWHKALGERGGP